MCTGIYYYSSEKYRINLNAEHKPDKYVTFMLYLGTYMCMSVCKI